MKDQKDMSQRRIIHEKSKRTIYEWFSFLQLRNELVKMGILNEKRCKKNCFVGTLINKAIISIIPVTTCVIIDIINDV
jgi:hypothetical protein